MYNNKHQIWDPEKQIFHIEIKSQTYDHLALEMFSCRFFSKQFYYKRKYTDLQYQFRSSYYPFFWWLLLRNGKISSKSLFWNDRTQRSDSRWQKQSYFTSTWIKFSITYFHDLFSNWYYTLTQLLSVTKQVLLSNKLTEYSAETVWLLQAWFANLLGISYDSLLLKEHVPSTQGS